MVMEQSAPGNAWKIVKDTSGNSLRTGHTVRLAYRTNKSGEVIRWDVAANGACSKSSANGGYYLSGELYVTESKDENENVSVEFKDKLGQVVLKKSYLSATDSLETYYVYDDFSLLRYVIPPKAVADPAINSTLTKTTKLVKKLCYCYEYDRRNRMVMKQLPGADSVLMVYDNRDRLVLTQDGNQRGNNKWLYSKYDGFNRVKETGFFTSSSSHATLQATVGVSDNYIPSNSDPLSYTVYDNYLFTWKAEFDSSRNISGNGYFNKVKGQVTGKKVKVLGVSGTYWETSTFYYDDKYRNIQIIKSLYPYGKQVLSSKYDFTGQLLQTKEYQQYKVLSSASYTSNTVDKYYDYDHMGRMLKIEESINGSNKKQLSLMSYNELGELETKKLHGTAQKIDYNYNIRGWLTDINKTRESTDKFSMNLMYENCGALSSLDEKGQYNGNISGMVWQNATGSPKAYAFRYDGINRLLKADYGEGTTVANSTKYDVWNIGYDKNGNIESLCRKEDGLNTDNLDYGYIGNRLKYVNDSYNDGVGFKESSNSTGDEYLYDTNGNMIKDLNKGISNTEYNFLNLPKEISKGSSTIKYVYSASGEKLQNIVSNNNKLSYCGNFVYENGSLKYILNEEGRYLVEGSTGKYEYNLTDHLGNVRMVIDTTGTVVQTSNYYPFGMRFATSGSPDNKYLYNGKELQEGTDWLDFGARMYQPDLVRWFCQDPHAENYLNWTPYNYVANNPVILIDPNGMDWFYYKKDGDEEANWHWREDEGKYSHRYTYVDEKGEKQIKTIELTGYEYLVGYLITGTNSEGASIGTINIYKQQDVVLSKDVVFAGSSKYQGTTPADKGTYWMAMNIRDADGPQKMNSTGDNPLPFWGAQKIPDNGIIQWNGKKYYNTAVVNAYGNGRIRLIPSTQVQKNNMLQYGRKDRGLYLHGKRDKHNWTHACICDKSEVIFNYLWKNVYKRTPFVIK